MGKTHVSVQGESFLINGKLTYSEIEHSIVLEHSQVLDIPYRIEDSIIGRDSEITRSPIKPKALKMTLGDHSKVGIL